MELRIPSSDLELVAHLAEPPGSTSGIGVVLCHGLPTGARGAAGSGATFPELADRIAREVSAVALAYNARASGTSPGEFSFHGWCDDLRAAIDFVVGRADTRSVVVVGVGEGGTIALNVAAGDPRVRAVATFATPVSLRAWGRDTARLVEYARRMGLVANDADPPGAAWGREAAALDVEQVAAGLHDRVVLVLHGSDDHVVPVADARAIAQAVGPSAELRIVQTAGHELRHDPRAVAALIGWLDRLP
jgi:putative redox protein